MIEVVPLDGVHQCTGLAALRNQIEPAARGEMARTTHPGQPIRHRVRPLEVVQEPRVDAFSLQRSLNGANIEGHIRSIIASAARLLTGDDGSYGSASLGAASRCPPPAREWPRTARPVEASYNSVTAHWSGLMI